MADETVKSYKIKFKFDESFKKLQKVQNGMKSFNKMQESSLRRQINLSKQLQTVRNQTRPSVSGSISKTQSVNNIAGRSASQAPAVQGSMDSHVKARLISKNAAEQEARALERARNTLITSAFWQKRGASSAHDSAKAAIKERIAKASTVQELKLIVAQERARLNHSYRQTKELQKQNFIMGKMGSSSKQMMGNYVGAFGAASVLVGITKIGQDFESVRNTMLSVSDGASEAGDNFKFVRDESYRLGLGLKDSAKGFAKMIAARGQMKKSDVKNLFTGFAEQATVLGLSTVEASRGINALMQMQSKGTVTAEELKQQLGEVLPSSMELMALAAKDAGISVSGTVEEMFKLQEQGALISSKVLPHFAKRMKEAAAPGLEGALKSNRVAMNRLITSIQEAADKFFQSGFSEGLTDLFNETSKLLSENGDVWESFGSIVGGILKNISGALEVLNPILKLFGDILIPITSVLKEFDDLLRAIFGKLFDFKKLANAIAGVGKEARKAKDGMSGMASSSVPNVEDSSTGRKGIGLSSLARSTPIGTAVLGTMTAIKRSSDFFQKSPNLTTPAEALSMRRSSIGINAPPIETTISVNLDGQVLGEAMAKSQDVENTIDSRIAHHST